eukprot:392993-Karenia_brevis.AAC.1
MQRCSGGAAVATMTALPRGETGGTQTAQQRAISSVVQAATATQRRWRRQQWLQRFRCVGDCSRAPAAATTFLADATSIASVAIMTFAPMA